MISARKLQYHKICTIVGGFIILLPNGVPWLWGNLSVYVFSYFHAKDTKNNSQIQTPWLMSVYLALGGLSMIAAPYVEIFIGRKKTLALGLLLYNVGVTTSYFVFDVSINLLNLTLGVSSGTGQGLIHAMVLQCVVEWAGNSKVGIITSGVISGYSMGSIVTNQFVTHYVNPDNLKPSDLVGPTRYFDQKDILQRTPNVFLFYGAGSLVLYIIGFCLVRKKPLELEREMSSVSDIESESGEYQERIRNLLKKNQSSEKCSIPKIYGTIQNPSVNRDVINSIVEERSEFINEEDDHNIISTSPNSLDKEDALKDANQADDTSNHDAKPAEIFKTKSFYSLWFSLLSMETAYIVVLNYYKTFGQVWIKSDHFLTNLGTVSGCVVVVARILWGFIFDRLGVKPSMVIFFSSTCIVSTFYYFTYGFSRWFYCFLTLVFFSLVCGVFTNFTVASLKIFGKKHFAANNGIVFTSTIVSNLLVPSLIQRVLSDYGWFELFFGVAVLNFIGLLLILILLKEC